MPGLFPAGTNQRPSEARANIWSDWDRFVGLSASLADKAELLAQASAKANDAREIGTSLLQLGRTCSACHESYRAPVTE